MDGTKICPYCGHEIKAVAKKCRFCGKWLDDTIKPIDQTSGHTCLGIPEPQHKNSSLKYIGIGVAILVIIAGVIVAIDLYVRNSDSNYEIKESTYNQEEFIDTVAIEEEPVPGEPIEEVPERILTHDADGNAEWVENPDYVDGSNLYDGTENGD